ncbi:respirasome Complex Assembly Factor 1-like [Haliotis rufescens]|uniref:respirasome Complex Assembly Factor 1-like n=1 Tax=Haliotis rufescens TaxID=6454 RepID=UPI00201FAB94|nr:respirasome Complex Assembly Factor 1-like [Haliotis rufescens]
MATTPVKRNVNKPVANGTDTVSIVSKAFTQDAEWTDKGEFLDVVYWLRQILGVVIGLIWGLIPLKGLVGLGLFFIINVAIVYIYYNSFQKVDEEEYGGASEILKEGLMTSFSSFLVSWIILYSSLHTDS